MAKFITVTHVAGVTKDRWECELCRFRFNRVKKNRNKQIICPGCKKEQKLDYKVIK